MRFKALSSIVKLMQARFKEPNLPWRINLSVTNLCNARCKMCNVWTVYRNSPQLIKDEMSIEHFKKLFDELDGHLLWLHLTGGEPFLRKDLIEIIEVAIAKCKNLIIIDISTNGLMPKHITKTIEHILEILGNKKIVFGVGISIDGPPDIHDSIRGVNGAWSKALETLMALKRLETLYSNLFVHVNYTITKYNSGYLKNTYEQLQRELGLDPNDLSISIEHIGLQFQNLNGRSIHEEEDKRKLMLKDLEWLIDCLRTYKLKRKRMPEKIRFQFKKFFVKTAIQYVINPTKRYFSCEALRSSIFIDPYGNVYPCTIWNVKLGNVREKSLREILRSASASRTRKLIISGACPNCLSGCEIWPSLILHKWSLVFSSVI